MSATRRIVLTLNQELYGRLEARAAEGNLAASAWAQRALQAALAPAAPERPESKAARDRRSREAGFALLSLLAGRPVGERSPHAANP